MEILPVLKFRSEFRIDGLDDRHLVVLTFRHLVSSVRDR